MNTNSRILFYNTAMLEAAGVDVRATMEEWVSAVRVLAGQNANGQQVWGWNICPFIWSFGGSLTNEEQTGATGYINSEATVKAVELVKEGALTGLTAPEGGFGYGSRVSICSFNPS